MTPGYLSSGKIQLCTLAVTKTLDDTLEFGVHFIIRFILYLCLNAFSLADVDTYDVVNVGNMV